MTTFMTSKYVITKCLWWDSNGLYVYQILFVFEIVMLQKIKLRTQVTTKDISWIKDSNIFYGVALQNKDKS